MRTAFLLLLLVNAVFFAYGWTVLENYRGGERLTGLEVNPGRIRVIEPTKPSRQSAGSLSRAQPSAPTVPSVCIEWGVVAGAEVTRADAAIGALELAEKQLRRVVTDAGGYWVYLPPAESRAQLDRALAELAALGIGDYYVVQEATPWRNAVSLGIFKTEESAQTFLQSLRTRGVKSAIVGHRENFLKHIAYFVRDPNQATIAKLAELQRAFPGTQMKAVACPTTLD
jgi:hypothetical protein